MKNKIILLLALLIMLIDCSSCVMRNEHGTPYHITKGTYRTHRHWGSRRNRHTRSTYWGRHRYGPRPYGNRGRQHY